MHQSSSSSSCVLRIGVSSLVVWVSSSGVASGTEFSSFPTTTTFAFVVVCLIDASSFSSDDGSCCVSLSSSFTLPSLAFFFISSYSLRLAFLRFTFLTCVGVSFFFFFFAPCEKMLLLFAIDSWRLTPEASAPAVLFLNVQFARSMDALKTTCSDVIGLPRICTNLSSFSQLNSRPRERFFLFFDAFAITVGAPLVSNNCLTLFSAFTAVVAVEVDVKLANPLAYNISHSAISSPMRSHNVPQCVLVANASALFTQLLSSLPLANLVNPKHNALFGFCRALKNFFCTVATRSFAVVLPIAGGELTGRCASSASTGELFITSGGNLSGSAMYDSSKTPLAYALESLSASSRFFITNFGTSRWNSSHTFRIASLTVYT